ncbi:MAG: glutamate-1-semialdehyde-2,1-aminomutase [Verrucomicrobia bacterium]|nr:glutamate-1-semialdehyde-2,1-aminomutase [Verrucomicrobiota bacterium]NBU68226.1 glutamate-1-semialdehyde-2,1-aminomutase [Verrucomicrobiota bacterium]
MSLGGGKRSGKLFEQAKRVTPGGVHSPVRAFRAVGGTPVFMVSAKGAYLRDADGKSYVDFVGSWGPAILGHAHPAVTRAVQKAAAKGLSFGTPHEGEVELSRLICRMVPSVKKVRFCNSGTEATMSCLRLARGFTGRNGIVKFSGCYHGHSDALLVAAGSGALTLGRPDSAGVTPGAVEDTHVLPFNDSGAAERLFARRGAEIAAVLVEPIPANAGLILPIPGFLEKLRDLTGKHGSLLIFDEVMTGFRLAPGGAQQILAIRPDLSAFGKVIGGGLPVGAFGGRAEVMDHLAPEGPVYQAGTLSGNPMAVAAGLAQLRALAKGNIYRDLERTGAALEKMFREELGSAGWKDPFVRVGSMFCLFCRPGGEPVRKLEEARKCDTGRYARLFHGLLEKGVYFPPSQFETCFLSAAHGEKELEITRKALREAFRQA